MDDGRGTTNPARTIVRDVLFLPRGGLGTRSGLSDNPVMSSAALLDISGRRVLKLHAGANDVRALAPGVYFVRRQGSRTQGFEDSSVTKVVISE